jgi:signal transduction histidine kinase
MSSETRQTRSSATIGCAFYEVKGKAMISLYTGRIEESDVRKRLLAWFQRGVGRVSEVCHRLAHYFTAQDPDHRAQSPTTTSLPHQAQSRDTLAAEIIHEVSNPLGSIALYASLIQGQSVGETLRWANEIMRASHRLQTIISQLVSFTAAASLAAEWLSVTLLLQEATEATSLVWQSGKWRLKTEVATELPPLWGDRVLLTQALINLLNNAAEAMPQGGTVTLRAFLSPNSSAPIPDPHGITIEVEDEGTGIAPHIREKVFNPFFTTKQSGTGIGLALTQKIIHAHYGTIATSDAPIRGCCVTVSLPAGDVQPSACLIAHNNLSLTHEETRGVV